MNTPLLITTATGQIEVDALWQEGAQAIALICHPHPLFGGTMDNKVVTTLARFAKKNGMHVVRFNFRGVGQSTGQHDQGIGEVDDAQAVLTWIAGHSPCQAHCNNLWLAGFSFGGFIAAKLAERMLTQPELSHWQLQRLTLVAPAVTNYDVSSLILPTAQTQMIYGDADDVIDPDAMAAFAERHGVAVEVLADAGHFFHRRLHDLTAALAVH